MSSTDRLYDRKAERLVLWALLERENLRSRIMSKLHNPEYFGAKETREAYERVIRIQMDGRQLPSVAALQHDPGLSSASKIALDWKGPDRATVRGMMAKDVDFHAEQILKHYRKRTLYEMMKWGSEAITRSDWSDALDEIVAEAQQRLNTANMQAGHLSDLTLGLNGNVSDDYLRKHLRAENTKILPTGIGCIDNRAHLSKGNIVLLTAKRGQGKSLLAKSLSLSHWRQGQSCVTFNLEMEEWEYFARLIAELTPTIPQLTHDRIRRGLRGGKLMKQILALRRSIDAEAARRGCRWSLKTVKIPGYTPQLMHQDIKFQGYDVVVIDYLNLFKNHKKDLWESIYDHTKYLKGMAKQENVLIYLLAQLSDDGHAKYARAAEEDADAWIHWEVNPGNPAVKFMHGKARHYRPFSFELLFDGTNTSFLDPDTVDDKRLRQLEKAAEKHAQELMDAQERVDQDRERTARRGGGPRSAAPPRGRERRDRR